MGKSNKYKLVKQLHKKSPCLRQDQNPTLSYESNSYNRNVKVRYGKHTSNKHKSMKESKIKEEEEEMRR